MLERLPVSKWHEWMAFMEIEPETDQGVIAQLANQQALYYNVKSKKGSPTKRQRDFLPQFMIIPPTPAQLRAQYEAAERQQIRTIDRANGRRNRT